MFIDTLPENDRIRYTISPSTRKELLRRLLTLNHERAAAEAAVAAEKPKKKLGKEPSATSHQESTLLLFDQESTVE